MELYDFCSLYLKTKIILRFFRLFDVNDIDYPERI